MLRRIVDFFTKPGTEEPGVIKLDSREGCPLDTGQILWCNTCRTRMRWNTGQQVFHCDCERSISGEAVEHSAEQLYHMYRAKIVEETAWK